MILETYAIWINSNNDIGIFFRPILVSFTPRVKEQYNYKFVEDSEEDFDVPDTEVRDTNIFMNVNNSNNNDNDSTQLELDKYINNLDVKSSESYDSDSSDDSYDSNISPKIENLDINLSE